MADKRDLISIADLSADETRQVILRAQQMKAGDAGSVLKGKKFALLFEKPSLRTRVSFQVGIEELGGYSLYLSPQEVGLGGREPVRDVARVLSGYVDCIIARVYSHQHLEELARYASVPVINALSDWEHPCQAISDLLTITEHKNKLDGMKLAYIGDGNNIARSLCLGLPPVGVSFAIAAPEGYNLDKASLKSAQQLAFNQGSNVWAVTSPAEAVRDADVVYTDVWTSMGDEAESGTRLEAFQGYTVGAKLLAQAKPDALFMHDMPAHYGEEVEPGMFEHPQSVVYQQAHNRLHGQKALLEFIFSGR
ncbi:MAG: ornithine carbamoyltransferase [Chloroflexi bacterium]|nr:ornithine carbamoyltransferase [Chloroflexota bacterium]MDA1218991.1 ornithine carbamoyltransferase [Chloroflexota bacterium]PKB57402.1 MAG: ornithine carbamoyltransferase [SAR202 cluster bacterium Casp-Chloro-G3]